MPPRRRFAMMGGDKQYEADNVPHLIVIILFVVVAWLGYRAYLREAERVHRRVRQAEREARDGTDGTLVKDPQTGEYRPRKD